MTPADLAHQAFDLYVGQLAAIPLPGSQLDLLLHSDQAERLALYRSTWLACEREWFNVAPRGAHAR